MSLLFTGTVAAAYTAGVIGIHRWSVWRRRALADGYPALDRLDWDTLLQGVWPAGPPGAVSPVPKEGGPAVRRLETDAGRPAAHVLLSELVQGRPVDDGAFERAGFSGGESAWLRMLATRVAAPMEVLEALSARPPDTIAEAYLREWLALRHEVTALSVEWQVYACKRRLSLAMRRFGDAPSLYFARAKASSLLGFNTSVIDDLGRAVFFSREAPFYVDAVLSMPFVRAQRPPLARACLEAGKRLGLTRSADEDRLDEPFESE